MKIDYTKIENIEEARSMIRTWGQDEDFGIGKARELYSSYLQTEDLHQKKHIGLLLAMLYDTLMSGIANECASGFGVQREDGLSLGESIYCDFYEAYSELYFRKKFADIDDEFNFQVCKEDLKILKNIIPPILVNRAILLFNEDRSTRIYGIRNIKGELRLIGVNTCRGDFLPDENIIDGEPPLYFTESMHFVSPVYYVNEFHAVMEYILKEIGYPPVAVKKSVVFPYKTAKNILEEEFGPDGEKEDYWIGVDVKVGISENDNFCLYNENFRKMYGSNMLSTLGNRLAMVFTRALYAASYLFRFMVKTKQLGKASYDDFVSLSNKTGIFE